MSEGKAGKRSSGHSPRRRMSGKEARAKGDFRNKAEGSSWGSPRQHRPGVGEPQSQIVKAGGLGLVTCV